MFGTSDVLKDKIAALKAENERLEKRITTNAVDYLTLMADLAETRKHVAELEGRIEAAADKLRTLAIRGDHFGGCPIALGESEECVCYMKHGAEALKTLTAENPPKPSVKPPTPPPTS